MNSLLRPGLMLLGLGILFPSACAAALLQPEPKESLDNVQRALDAPEADRQRAALVLIPELGLKKEQAAAMAGHLERYLKKTTNDENTSLALIAYSKLSPPSGTATGVVKNYLTSKSVLIRRGAGQALVELISASARDFRTPPPVIIVQGNVGAVGISGGAATAVVWTREWVASVANDDRSWARFGEDSKNLLPLCAIALKDPDDEVRMSGGEGIRQVAHTVAEILPDPATSNPETKVIDPFEAKLKWLFLQPALEALNANVASLKDGMTAKKLEARMAATRAAEAVTQARSLALASRRYPPDDMQTFVKNVPPEDALKTGAMSVLPALADRLNDESTEIRLVAIEGFEHQGVDARSYLGAIIHASMNDYVFVRWVATRTLGRLFDGASAAQAAQIVKAVAVRMQDTDLDVRMAALTAIAKGESAARPATGAILKLAMSGDPDQRVEAIKTLTQIHAEPSETVAAIASILNSTQPIVRKQAAMYLGSLGHAARASLPQLRPLLLDVDEEVRREAAKALLAIE